MKELTTAQFESEVLKGGTYAVDFFSTECPPCEALAPKFDGLAELYGKDIQFVKIYRQGNRELADKLGVKSSPTILFYQNGKEVGSRLSGGVKKSEIVTQLNNLITAERANEIKSKITPSVTDYDVIILGAGPGGLTAGLYLGQAKAHSVLVDPQLPGGYMSTTHQVSNYPGFVEPQAGYMLSHYMSEQTKEYGTEFKVAVDITKVDLAKKEIVIDEYETLRAKKIIIATGTRPNPLGIPGENEYKGKGISYCATCDAKYFGDKEVVVIGGGNSAVEEADFITKFATKVTLVHQFDQMQANKQAQEKLLANPKVEFMFSHEPRKIEKNGDKMRLTVENLKTKEMIVLDTDGIFVFIGFQAVTEMFNENINKDQWGYIVTNEDMETNIDGVYAVGDIRSKKYRQITTAVADGTIAAIAITRALNQ